MIFKDQDPDATPQTRYLLASMALTDLFRDIGQMETALHFHTLAEAWGGSVGGIKHPLFKISASGKRGRKNDTAAVWRIRAYVAIGLEYLILGEMEADAAVAYVYRKHRQKLAKLQRPGANLKTSLAGWRKQFASDEVTNKLALSTYKLGLEMLKSLTFTKSEIQLLGKNYLEKTAIRALDLP